MRYSIWTAFILSSVALSAFSTDANAMYSSRRHHGDRRDDEHHRAGHHSYHHDKDDEAGRLKRRAERHKRHREDERRGDDEDRAEVDRRKRLEERDARRDREVLEAAKEMSRRANSRAEPSPPRKRQKTDDDSALAASNTPLPGPAASASASARYNPFADVDDFLMYSPSGKKSGIEDGRLEKAKEFARQTTLKNSIGAAQNVSAQTHAEQTPPQPQGSPPQRMVVHYEPARDPRRRPRLPSIVVVNGATVAPSLPEAERFTTTISAGIADMAAPFQSPANAQAPLTPHAPRRLLDQDGEMSDQSLTDDEEEEADALGTHAAKCLFPKTSSPGSDMELDEDSVGPHPALPAQAARSPSPEPAHIIEDAPPAVLLEQVNDDAPAAAAQGVSPVASPLAVEADEIMAEDGPAPVVAAAPEEEAAEEGEMQVEHPQRVHVFASTSDADKFKIIGVMGSFLNLEDFQALWGTSQDFCRTLEQNMRPDLPWMPRSTEVMLVEGIRAYPHIFPGVRSLHWAVEPRSLPVVMRTLTEAKNAGTLAHLRRLIIEFKGDALSQTANSQGLLSPMSIPRGLQELLLKGSLAQRAVNQFWENHATSSAPHPIAQYHYAQSLVTPNGTYIPAQELQAIPLWRGAAESGHTLSRYKIAHIAWTAWTSKNQSVQDAVSLSPETAVAYLEEATKAGILDARYYHGRILYEGWDSIAPNPKQAVALWRDLTQKGHPGAHFWLSDALWRGVGTEQDQGSALRHLQIAHTKGYGPAADRLTALNTAWNTASGSSRRPSQVRRVSPSQL